jgi:hypothetical protein
MLARSSGLVPRVGTTALASSRRRPDLASTDGDAICRWDILDDYTMLLRPAFRARIQAAVRELRVVGSRGTPLGFQLVWDDELHQLYVAVRRAGSARWLR